MYMYIIHVHVVVHGICTCMLAGYIDLCKQSRQTSRVVNYKGVIRVNGDEFLLSSSSLCLDSRSHWGVSDAAVNRLLMSKPKLWSSVLSGKCLLCIHRAVKLALVQVGQGPAKL